MAPELSNTLKMKTQEPFDFAKLESFRLLTREILQDQVASLQYYAFDGGYEHYKGKKKISVSSTATCVLSLVATRSWPHDKPQTKALLKTLVSKTTSAGLPEKNPFTIAWILDAVTALQDQHSDPLDDTDNLSIAKMEQKLQDALNSTGGVRIETYPPSAYLTQLVVRVLRRRSKLTPSLEDAVRVWAWHELTHELALIHANSKTADPIAVAYLLMLVTAVTPRSKMKPDQTRIQHHALQTFFSCQLADGTWPLSRPLFHYEKFGNAHCYEYEMLTQLLQESELQELLLDYLPELNSAAQAILRSVYRLEDGIRAWQRGQIFC